MTTKRKQKPPARQRADFTTEPKNTRRKKGAKINASAIEPKKNRKGKTKTKGINVLTTLPTLTLTAKRGKRTRPCAPALCYPLIALSTVPKVDTMIARRPLSDETLGKRLARVLKVTTLHVSGRLLTMYLRERHIIG